MGLLSKKPAPEEKATTEESPEPMSEMDTLTAKVTNMEQCLSKMAHMTGNQRVLDEFGIARWEVTQESMRKRKG